MKNKMQLLYDKDKIDEFCLLFKQRCEKLIKNKEQYNLKSNFIHNLILNETKEVFLYIMQDTKKRKRYIKELLKQDDMVSYLVACYCLRYGKYKIRSRKILKQIYKTSSDDLLRYSCNLALKEYNIFYKGNISLND